MKKVVHEPCRGLKPGDQVVSSASSNPSRLESQDKSIEPGEAKKSEVHDAITERPVSSIDRRTPVDPRLAQRDVTLSSTSQVVRSTRISQLMLPWSVAVGAEVWLVPDGETPRRLHPIDGSASLGEPGLGPGLHRLEMRAGGSDGASQTRVHTLIVAPPTSFPVEEILSARGVAAGAGVSVDLYGLRSENNWGVGDFSDVDSLVVWAAKQKLSYVGLPPMHALRNRGLDLSPYSPVSRTRLNILYIDVEQIPEAAGNASFVALKAKPQFSGKLDEFRSADQIDYDAVLEHKLEALRMLYAEFCVRPGPGRSQAYEAFLRAEGRDLVDFGVFCALQDHLGGQGDWRNWPKGFRDVRSPGVQQFAVEHSRQVDFYMWLQFEARRQLHDVSQRARQTMGIGLYADFAVGSAPGGFDTWAHPDLFLLDSTAGAPPDYFNPKGQDWGFPPLNPDAFETYEGCEAMRRLLAANMADAGALRIDHAIGLQHIFTVPTDGKPTDGAYLNMPQDTLIALIALESWRNRCVVIGEDLGAVPEGLRERLSVEKLLGYRVLPFEKTKTAQSVTYPNVDAWQRDVIATATTHDTESLRAFWTDSDLQLRVELGTLGSDDLDQATRERQRDKQGLLDALKLGGFLQGGDVDFDSFNTAVHAYLGASNAVLVDVRLSNLAAQQTPVNVPGVGLERYPSWQARMDRPLAQLLRDPQANRVVAALRAQRCGP